MILEKKAFTLIEVLVAIAIFSILSAGAVWFFIGSSRDVNIIWEQLTTQNQGKKTLEKVTKYIRKAETSSAGAYPLVTTTPYNLIFYANVDSDSMIEKVEFKLDNDKVLRQIITNPSSTASSNMYGSGIATSQPTILAENVINKTTNPATPVFLYYNENYTGTQSELSGDFNLVKVHMVKVQLELEKDFNKSPAPLHLESAVLIRSTKTNR